MVKKQEQRNGRISLLEKIWIVITLIQLPFVVGLNVVFSPWSARNKHKTILRVVGDSATRFVSSRLSLFQLQNYFGSSTKAYQVWAKRNKLPAIIDDLSEDARLLWIGYRQTDRVLLYCHGGGFLTCLSDPHLSFCRHVQTELEARNVEVRIGIAILQYSLVPDAPFPTQLRQLIFAIQHLFSMGVQPGRLHLAGDSAGANLILQLLSHTLHPLPHDLVQPSPLGGLPAKVCGVFLMSPWTAVTADFRSSEANMAMDWPNRQISADLGALVLEPVPRAQRVYLEVAKAPEEWFDGVDNIVGRFLVSLGDTECLYDVITTLIAALRQYHSSVDMIMQQHGVHNDPLQDFFVKEKNVCDITSAVIEWVAAGYENSHHND